MEERGGGAGSGAHLAVIAGIFATSGSLLGKLAGGADASSLSSLFLKGVLLIFMIVCNTIGCTFFVKALHTSGSSLPITVASAATNYICSGRITPSDTSPVNFMERVAAVSVLPGLYVGNYQDSKDADQLERFEITHILAIHDTARRLHSDKHYLCILAADSPDQNLSQYFSLCNDFIHAARLRGGNVLIHCLAGMSRSVTVAVAYIMSTTSLSWKEALKVVRVGRSIANPNVGFQQQLKDFESSRLQDERNRLKERFPSLALTESDAEVCRSTLRNYETLALAKEVCEGKCAMGRTCPTGLCRQATKRTLRRKSSTSSIGSVSSGRTPPQTPRMLPSAPPSPALHRSSSVMSTSRPRSGPAGLHSYTGGSAPPSRAVSRVDLSAAVACSSSNTNLSAIGRSSAFSSSNWRLTAGSAPNTPRPTPPVSPQRWPRRLSNRQTPQLPAPPESHPSTMT
ncbi:DUS22 phosphatase, partial [Acromyrmex heyeri]